MNLSRKNTGFTLIELSIVLVILGLIVGAIVGGKSLVHQARLQSVIREYISWKTAYNAFLTQYNAKPGDMKNGYTFFANGSNANCGSNAISDRGCNGNGDNIVGTGTNWEAEFAETVRFWNHLRLAEFIPGRVTYRHNTTTYNVGAPTYRQGAYWNNIPQAKGAEGDAGWIVPPEGNTFGKAGIWFMIAEYRDGNHDCIICNPRAALTPADARSIDKKSDDGIPTMGYLTVMRGFGKTSSERCSSNDWWAGSNVNSIGWANDPAYSTFGNTPSTSDTYTLSSKKPTCVMLFYNGNY